MNMEGLNQKLSGELIQMYVMHQQRIRTRHW